MNISILFFNLYKKFNFMFSCQEDIILWVNPLKTVQIQYCIIGIIVSYCKVIAT